jgi:glycosyltransferase involved in cell wall biosynthesis
VLLHPARLVRRKRVEVSLRVVAALKETGRTAALLVTGPPDLHNAQSVAYAAELHAMRDELGLQEHALFLHPDVAVTRDDLPSLYQVADALLFPSRDEGFGLPLLEAALHRMPLFCTDVPPLNSAAPPLRHLFAPAVAPRELADMIAREIDASSVAQARKVVARDFAWESIYRKFLAPLLGED